MASNNENISSNEVPLAITFPNSQDNVSQPRQPSNLQGLLRFAMETTKTEDPTTESSMQPMDEESKKFLEGALKSLTVDVIDILLEAINILRTASDLSVDSDITEHLNAFDTIVDYVDRIDTAIDFHKIGGYDIFIPCLNCVHLAIRASACNLLAELCQNNPYCQNKALESGFLTILIDLLKTDEDVVVIKTLYALSCMLRDHQPSLNEFRKIHGIPALMAALQRPAVKIRIKICFLLSVLCTKDATLTDELVSAGYVQCFISLLAEDRNEFHEHVLCLLATIVRDSQAAVIECQRPEYGLESILRNYYKLIENMEEATEEKEYCQEILFRAFSSQNSSVER